MRSKIRSKAGGLGVILAVAVGGAVAIAYGGITHMPATEQQQSDTPAVAQDISTIAAQTAASPVPQNLEEIVYTAKCAGINDTSQHAKILLYKDGKLVTSVVFVNYNEPGSRPVFNGGYVELTRHYFPCLDGAVDAKDNRVYGLAAYLGTKGPSLVRSFDFDGKPVSDYWTKEPIRGIAIAYDVISDGNDYVVSIGNTLDGKPAVHLLKTDGLELAATYIPKGKEGSPFDLQVIPVKGENDSLLQFKLRDLNKPIDPKSGGLYSISAIEMLNKYAVTPAK